MPYLKIQWFTFYGVMAFKNGQSQNVGMHKSFNILNE